MEKENLNKIEEEVKEFNDKKVGTIDTALKTMNVDIEKLREDEEYRQGVVADFKLDLENAELNWSDLNKNYLDLSNDILEQQLLVVGLVKEKEKLLEENKEFFLTVLGLMKSIEDLAKELGEIKNKFLPKLDKPVIGKDDIDEALEYVKLEFAISDIRERFILLVTNSVTDIISKLRELKGEENGKTGE